MKADTKIIDIVYVDDSAFCHTIFEMTVNEYDNVHVMNMFTDAEKALDFCAVHPPDIAIIDIEMPGQDGIWLAEKLKKLGIEFVLLTSHNTYAAESYKLEALHYLIKPFNKPDFTELLKRYEQKIGAHELHKKNTELTGRIFVNTQKQIVVLQFTEIVYAKAEGSYTYFQLANGKTIVSGKTLKTYISALLQNSSFIKIHRAYIINQDYLESINKKRLDMRFKFKTGHEIQIATLKKGDWLNNEL